MRVELEEAKRKIDIVTTLDARTGKKSLMIREHCVMPDGRSAWAFKRFAYRVLRYKRYSEENPQIVYDHRDHYYRSGLFETPVRELFITRFFMVHKMEVYFVIYSEKKMFQFLE